jgi:hypothetical protein
MPLGTVWPRMQCTRCKQDNWFIVRRKHQKANAKRPRNVHGGFRAAQVFAFGYVLAPKGVRSLCGVTRLHFVLRGEVSMMRIGVQQLHSG